MPLGLQAWMEEVGCENVVELDWWEENHVPEHSDTFFVFTPAQHWSKRTINDDNKVLYTYILLMQPVHFPYNKSGFKELLYCTKYFFVYA